MMCESLTFGTADLLVGETRASAVEAMPRLPTFEDLARAAVTNLTVKTGSSTREVTVSSYELGCALLLQIYFLSSGSDVSLELGEGFEIYGARSHGLLELRMFADREENVIAQWSCGTADFLLFLNSMLCRLADSMGRSAIDLHQFFKQVPPALD
jgi:hypothetical protein